MKYVYHGSITSGITDLKACSKLHDSNERVVYLTDNIPYALFYIWDQIHNGYNGKYVTGWIKNGIAYYEEQFPEQLKTFYKGVSGYLYSIAINQDIQTVPNRECMFFSKSNCIVDKSEYIPDVYEEMLRYESLGEFKLLRYKEQSVKRQKELIDLVAFSILKADFYKNNEEHARFMQKYFSIAWTQAERWIL